MKTLQDVIKATSIEITEITAPDGKKMWRCKNERGEEITGQLGYKAFKKDWTCKNRFQYKVGMSFEEKLVPHACWSGYRTQGLHYCAKPADIFNYYSFDDETKIALVLAYGDIDSRDGEDKSCTNKLFVIREIPRSEFLELANEGKDNTGLRNTGDSNTGDSNTGDSNTGDSNTGHRNTGDSNTGHRNTGDSNTGHRNTGHRNTGHRNTGHRNTGDSNTGHRNFGNRCTGDFNIADDSSGVFCTEQQKIRIFDCETDMTLDQWRCSSAYNLLRRVSGVHTEWKYACEMNDEEKRQHPNYEMTNGYLKVIPPAYDRYVKWWNALCKSEREIIMGIPNFNAEKFKLITGIDVNDPNGHTRCYKAMDRLDVGDKVIISITPKYDGPFGYDYQMLGYTGKVATITKVYNREAADPCRVDYRIDLDNGSWHWSTMMFGKVVQE